MLFFNNLGKKIKIFEIRNFNIENFNIFLKFKID